MTATVDNRAQTHVGALIVVVLDRAHARFFEVTASGTVELPSLHSPAMRGGKFHSDRQGGPGWGERDYQGRIREEERRHHAKVTERLIKLQRAGPLAGVVLAGRGSAAAALRGFLPPALADQVIGSVQLDATDLTPARVREMARDLQEAHRRATERALVGELVEALGTGWAENGTRAVLAALARRQVRTLLVRSDVRGMGFRCARSGRLVLSASDCRGEGQPVPVHDLVTEAIADAQAQDAAIVVVTDPETAKAIDGLAALLRFREKE
ncbi:MAG TPA: host attachment protein [Gemmatimonadales bacterium]|nr:host attachment protein [Gemmatimonadales bacterium]